MAATPKRSYASRMPSMLHELLVLLFRNLPKLAADFLRASSRAKLPPHFEAQIGSAEFTDIKPAQYHADLVVLLMEEGIVRAIIVEVQLSVDERKRYTWPVYVSNLRAQLECPTSLLVVTLDETVARWAAEPFELVDGYVFAPQVLHQSVMPKVTDEAQARAEPELALLSAVMHARDSDTHTTKRIASAAWKTVSGLKDDRSKVYLDLLRASLSQTLLEELHIVELSDWELKSDYLMHCLATSRAEGQSKVILRQLAARFGPLSDDVQTRIKQASSDELDVICERLLTAPTLQQAIDPQ